MVLVYSNVIEDIVFCISIFLCFTLASNYKNIEDCDKRREFSAGLGLFVTCLICGTSLYHVIMIVWGNVILIKCGNKKYVHLLSLSYTWLYLIYIYNNLIMTPYATWLFQTIALRMVGVSYEMAIFHKQTEGPQKGLQCLDYTDELEKPSVLKRVKSIPDHSYGLQKSPLAIDIIAYAFCFVGIHKGFSVKMFGSWLFFTFANSLYKVLLTPQKPFDSPYKIQVWRKCPYYDWKVFYTNLYESSMIEYKCNKETTINNLQKALASALGFVLVYAAFPTDIYCKEDFYTKYSCVARYFMGVPHLIMFFLRSYTIIVICACVFTESNFGYYSCSSLDIYRKTKDTLENDTVTKCLENQMLLMMPLMSETIRYYDMPAGYWFTLYAYNHTLKSRKAVRSAFSFFLWSIWRGASLTEFLLAVTTWVYVQLEMMYSDIFEYRAEANTAVWYMSFGIMRLLYLIYIAPCLVVYDPYVVFQFYSSLFWAYHLVIVGLTFSAAIIRSNKLESNLS